MQSSSSSQDLLQREQQIEEVLEQHQNRPPTTSKVRTYVSTSRNTGSAFVDRVNSFGDIRTPEQLNQEEGDDELAFELGGDVHPMWASTTQLHPIPLHNSNSAHQETSQFHQESSPVRERSNFMELDQHEIKIELRLQALPERLKFASREALHQEKLLIQEEMKGLNNNLKSIAWHQRQAQRRSQEFQTSQSEPLVTFERSSLQR